MDQLDQLAGLAAEWRAFTAKRPAPNDISCAGSSDYRSGLDVCAGQLEDMIARLRQDAEA